MPRNGPDLSQRPRREAPGMLTAIAILERELGQVEYDRLRIEKELGGRPPSARKRRLEGELGALERRKREAVRLLDETHAKYGGAAA